jgi:hypothetical protein
MSHYNTVRTEFRDRALLVASLEAVGFKPLTSDIAQALTGFENDRRPQTAEVIVPRKQVGALSNDIGFKRQPDGSFAAVISDYDREKYGKKWLGRLKLEYGVARVTRLARMKYGCAKPIVKKIQTPTGPKTVVKFILP